MQRLLNDSFGAVMASLISHNPIDVAEWLDERQWAGIVMLLATVGILVLPIAFIVVGFVCSRKRDQHVQSAIWISVAFLSICSAIICYIVGKACAYEIVG